MLAVSRMLSQIQALRPAGSASASWHHTNWVHHSHTAQWDQTACMQHQ